MSRVGRLAGALMAQTGDRYFLIGNTKEPCDFAAAGFEPPAEIDATKRPYLELRALEPVQVRAPWLLMNLEGEALPRLLAERLVIERNGSVSERLWRLVIDPDGELDDGVERASVDAGWLAEIPTPVWQIVRDTVLRCI